MASTPHERAAPRASFARRTRYLRQHKRLALSVLLGFFTYLLLPRSVGEGTRLLVAFDLAAVVFLGAVWIMMARATTAEMRRRSQIEDESRYVVLALSAAAAVAVLLAITSQLQEIRDQTSTTTALHVSLAAVTIVLAWFFMNTIFALHYAQFFYGNASGAGEARGLDFPGRAEPDYWDFLYFSFEIGMTFQVPTCRSRTTTFAGWASPTACWLSFSTSWSWPSPSISSQACCRGWNGSTIFRQNPIRKRSPHI
jgi:uncharacterized membrane protein